MRSRICMLALLLVIAVAGSFSWTGHGQTAPTTVWEYKIIFDANANNEKKLNELGTQGWELTAIRTVVFQGTDTGGYYYLKRAR